MPFECYLAALRFVGMCACARACLCGLMFVFYLPLGSFRISSRNAGPARRNIRLEMVFFSVRVSSVEFVIASASISDISPSLFFYLFSEDKRKKRNHLYQFSNIDFFQFILISYFCVSAWAVGQFLCGSLILFAMLQ